MSKTHLHIYAYYSVIPQQPRYDIISYHIICVCQQMNK